ncbi:MAG: ATP-grasp domain-containing protein, partial [Planctomycetota bacterium]|nr:ATP-grasp domain-containing protein [Planctomycetota bacterium]
MSEHSSPLLIFGASSRAAAFSAHRAGIETLCADLFADADLADTTTVRLSGAEYPSGLLPILEKHEGPWLYTGALENYPDLIARAESKGELWGNTASVLGRVRDPFLLKEFADSAGLLMPRCRYELQEVGEWLQKPFRSGCGTGISFAASKKTNETPAGYYYQEHMSGIPCSAVFVGFDSHCLLLGATRQLIGEGSLNVRDFKYCGNIGPLSLTQSQGSELARMGSLLVSEYRLRGLFGVDFIRSPDGISFWMLEINPRYSASVEVLELATGLNAMGYHKAAFRDRGIQSLNSPSKPERIVAKAILFSDRDFKFPEIHDPTLRWPHVADIPHPGTPMMKGQPVMTIFSEGVSAD